MKNTIRNLKKQLKNFQSLALRYAQWKSISSWTCIDANNQPIPWYTYPAIEYLDHLDFSNMHVFEFGSGNSTLWWARHAYYVKSVEHNNEWYSKISSLATNFSNVDYELKIDKAEYLLSFNSGFDIVIIDGIYRQDCANIFLQFSEETSMLIFDNSDWYPRTIQKLNNELRWLQVDFHGFGSINNYTWTTTIFFNPSMAHRLSYRKELHSISGLVQNCEVG